MKTLVVGPMLSIGSSHAAASRPTLAKRRRQTERVRLCSIPPPPTPTSPGTGGRAAPPPAKPGGAPHKSAAATAAGCSPISRTGLQIGMRSVPMHPTPRLPAAVRAAWYAARAQPARRFCCPLISLPCAQFINRAVQPLPCGRVTAYSCSGSIAAGNSREDPASHARHPPAMMGMKASCRKTNGN